MPETAHALDVAMIGPVPPSWGGGGRWQGGGVASHVHGLLPRLGKEGISVQLLAENSSWARSARFPQLTGVGLQPMARSPWQLARLGPGRLLKMILLAWNDRVLKYASPSRRLRFAAQAANFDRFLAQTSPDLLHVHHAYHRQYLCQSLLNFNRPVVVTAHSVSALLRPHPTWLERMSRTNYRRADHLIAVSSFVHDQIIAFGADPASVTVIPNGVDLEYFKDGSVRGARRELDLPEDGFVFLFTGNLIPPKGVDHLLHAFQMVQRQGAGCRLLVVGDGPEEERLRRLANEMGIAGAVVFAGRRPLSEMGTWYRAANAYVLPSAAEGLSMAILEAMASARPVITTHAGESGHDAVIPGKTGLLTEYGNVAQLAHAMKQLIESPDWARQLGENGRRRAERHFSWPDIARRTAGVYRQALEQQP